MSVKLAGWLEPGFEHGMAPHATCQEGQSRRGCLRPKVLALVVAVVILATDTQEIHSGPERIPDLDITPDMIPQLPSFRMEISVLRPYVLVRPYQDVSQCIEIMLIRE